jgi:hypothetical protein
MRTIFKLSSIAFCAVAATGAYADSMNRCDDQILRGTYVFAATGFTRAPNSAPGTPWVPKAIQEVIEFNGDGTVTTPSLTVANPFADSGDILKPPSGAPGEYTVNDDCTGTLHFFDAANVTFSFVVKMPRGDEIAMIQTNPSDNVFQGTASRIW